MKKLFLAILAAGCVFTSCSDDNNDDKDTVIDATELPVAAQEFIAAHFPGVGYTRVEKELVAYNDSVIYEIDLNNGFEVDFDTTGNWDVDGGNRQVPASIVPAAISEYVVSNYATLTVTGIEKRNNRYSIELSDDTDILFTAEGEFVRADRD